MNRRISRNGAIGLIICAALAAVLAIYLSGRFGGPTVRFSSLYEVSAVLPDSKGLADRSDVLERGVPVGQIEKIGLRHGLTYVTFALSRRYAPLRRGASIEVAEKTLLGESFIDLHPGPARAPRLASGSRLPPAGIKPASVEIDQALNALDPQAIAHVKSMLHSFARGASSPYTSERVDRTLANLPLLTTQLRLLAQTLHGQEGDIAAGVIDTHTVLLQLGEREQEVRTLISSARTTLSALGARGAALAAGLRELPPLLDTTRRTLHDARPLLTEARPLLADLRRAAPPLAVALRRLPPVTRDAGDLIARLPSFNRTVVPFLGLLGPVLGVLRPAGVDLGPAVRNLVSIAAYLSSRRNTFTTWFANTAALGSNADAKGHFARFFIFAEPGTAFGLKGGDFSNNPYTQPNDALANQPYSGFPHLVAFNPGAPRR
ncbi:MAG: MlaD family protein [Solirubrobacteraceae bacterium]